MRLVGFLLGFGAIIYLSWNQPSLNIVSAFSEAGLVVSEELQFRTKFNNNIKARFDADTLAASVVTVRGGRGAFCFQNAYGTGFFLNDLRSVVTAWHITEQIADHCRLTVSLRNGVTLAATEWKADRYGDVARLRIEQNAYGDNMIRGIRPLSYKGAVDLRVGDPVFVPASNRGVILSGWFLNKGVCGKEIDGEINDSIRFSTKSSLRSGDSGSPLIDADGNVLGIVFAGVEQEVKLSSPLKLTTIRFPNLGCAAPIPSSME